MTSEQSPPSHVVKVPEMATENRLSVHAPRATGKAENVAKETALEKAIVTAIVREKVPAMETDPVRECATEIVHMKVLVTAIVREKVLATATDPAKEGCETLRTEAALFGSAFTARASPWEIGGIRRWLISRRLFERPKGRVPSSPPNPIPPSKRSPQ
jgi:hypothetical protein